MEEDCLIKQSMYIFWPYFTLVHEINKFYLTFNFKTCLSYIETFECVSLFIFLKMAAFQQLIEI